MVAPTDMSCVWTIDDHNQAIGLRATGLEPVVRLPMGEHSVMVTVRLGDGRSWIRPRDDRREGYPDRRARRFTGNRRG